MVPLILRLDNTGQLMGWIPWQAAVVLYAKDRISWTTGDSVFRVFGGRNRHTCVRSYIDIHSIIASKGTANRKKYAGVPPLTSRELFRRDRQMCMYCLQTLPESRLTRDHVVPLAQGGADTWTNVVTACVTCNQRKGSRTPEQANMPLYAVPFVPNYAEWLVLRNKRILADQMEFLKSQFRKDSALLTY